MTEWWRPTFQTTVDAYYRGDIAAGLRACELLNALDDLPEKTERRLRQNLVFYTSLLCDLAPSTRARQIEIPVPSDWSQYNPSIAAADDGFRLILRSGNYQVDPPLRYTYHDPGGIVRTTNYLLDLAPDLMVREVQTIDDAAFRPDPPHYRIAGYEDCRLVRHRDAWWYSATVRDRDADGVCRIALVRLEGATAIEEHLLSNGRDRQEKNWMPVADGDGSLRFVYGCAPVTLLRFCDDEGRVAEELVRPSPSLAQRFRGGSQAIPVDSGHLCLVHEVVWTSEGGRIYLHRWVWFDAEWWLARISPPFTFRERGIEFAAGLAQQGDDLIISYGVWDRAAWLATVPLAEVLPLLAPPLDPGEAQAEIRSAEPYPVLAESGDVEPTKAPAQETGFMPAVPTIVSTTLSGNSADVVADALRSVVDWVDWCLLIDTGISDGTLKIAQEVAGKKLVVREFPWRDDFAAARNFAFEAAAELGADWAITLDTDERIELNGADVRGVLALTDADSLHVEKRGGNYGKERLFRLPARGHWVGPTHEAYIRNGRSVTLPGVQFDELGKTHEQYRQKVERDIAILTRQTAEHPDDPRWYYYLGDSYAGVERYEEAIAAFRICASLDGWDEEGAWAMYRSAQCFLRLGRPKDAIGECAVGMGKHPGLPDLPWLAGYAAWQADNPAHAAYWARHAIALGHFAGAGAIVPRIGFRHPPALWEGPYDILRFALRKLGDDAGADEAERFYHAAMLARQQEPAEPGTLDASS